MEWHPGDLTEPRDQFSCLIVHTPTLLLMWLHLPRLSWSCNKSGNSKLAGNYLIKRKIQSGCECVGGNYRMKTSVGQWQQGLPSPESPQPPELYSPPSPHVYPCPQPHTTEFLYLHSPNVPDWHPQDRGSCCSCGSESMNGSGHLWLQCSAAFLCSFILLFTV